MQASLSGICTEHMTCQLSLHHPTCILSPVYHVQTMQASSLRSCGKLASSLVCNNRQVHTFEHRALHSTCLSEHIKTVILVHVQGHN